MWHGCGRHVGISAGTGTGPQLVRGSTYAARADEGPKRAVGSMIPKLIPSGNGNRRIGSDLAQPFLRFFSGLRLQLDLQSAQTLAIGDLAV